MRLRADLSDVNLDICNTLQLEKMKEYAEHAKLLKQIDVDTGETSSTHIYRQHAVFPQ